MSETGSVAPSRLPLIRLVLAVIVGVAAIVIGAFALIWTTATLPAVGFLFGLFLVIAAIDRLGAAFDSRRTSALGLVVNLVVGVALVVVGLLCINNVATSALLVAIFVGGGWIAGGIADLVAAARGSSQDGARMFTLSGGVSILAGAVMLLLPVFSLTVFVKVAAVLLIVIGIVVLTRSALTRRSRRRHSPS